MFTKGHIFTVMEISEKLYKLIDENGIILNGVDRHYFNKNLSMENSKIIYYEKIKHFNLIKLIKENCKQKDYNYVDYDRYDTCKLKYDIGGFYFDQCIPTEKCIEHCDSKIFRYFKIQNIKNKINNNQTEK